MTIVNVETIINAFASANIPLHKLRCPTLLNLFNNLGHSLPREATCRKALDNIYEYKIADIKMHFNNKNFFLVVDESKIQDNKI